MIENSTTFDIAAILALGLSGFLVVYSHLLYPLILKVISKKESRNGAVHEPDNSAQEFNADQLPRITIVIPAYNEEASIAQKICNLSALDYPGDRFDVIIHCDGCTDKTFEIAEATLATAVCRSLNISLVNAHQNIGKIAVLNRTVPKARGDIIAFSDVSALLSINALKRLALNYRNKDVGIVAGTYDFFDLQNSDEQSYWQYQRNIKIGEQKLGALIGCHGAFYSIRKELFSPLAPDTINDDFMIPMSIQQNGFKGVYDRDIIALELESSNRDQDYKRRIRISRGNIQQVLRLLPLLHPKFGGLAFSFLSTKVLRALTPILLILCLVSSVMLAMSKAPLFQITGLLSLTAQLTLYSLTLLHAIYPKRFGSGPVSKLAYLVRGHLAGLAGWGSYLFGQGKGTAWNKTPRPEQSRSFYIPQSVQFSKRLFDVSASLAGLLALLPLFPLIALLIRLDSPGPALFRQKRVGLATADQTQFFEMVKFRTMRTDAEKKTGAVWAQKNDPRVTRIGRFLRKTRIDELPQLWNVLKGDMSLIGPRPERPELYGKLEKAVPFFAERNFGVRPGITGPAQIFNGYDATIEDVRNKAAWDHSYALQLSDVKSWVSVDLEILFKTVGVIVGRRGQ
ncbi:sugar transferase [Kiloniella sp. b19]|uniref:sugar transferase n=1 Tax=Kiloniella sp. GXU_MW_B19 TaxID=3141326 RepID=UPI0031DD2403